MGELFYRNQPIPIILEMNYTDLKYWHNWHMAIEKQWKKSVDGVNNRNA
jgi:hypothetical protein